MENNITDNLEIKTSDAVQGVEDAIESVPLPEVNRDRIVDNLGRAYGTGKKKCSIARVWIKRGSGKFIINNEEKSIDSDIILSSILNRPFFVTDTIGKFDVFCTIKGGGSMSQLHAIRHAISVALSRFSPSSYYRELKSDGLMTRDSRIVERKKFGRKKARKRFQFSKR